MSTAAQRPCRLDLRLTSRQRANYERAAEAAGLTMTQWATSHLDLSAKRDIDDAAATTLAPEAFDAFCAMLEAPLPEAAEELLGRKAVWE